jgi:hypothetical protein
MVQINFCLDSTRKINLYLFFFFLQECSIFKQICLLEAGSVLLNFFFSFIQNFHLSIVHVLLGSGFLYMLYILLLSQLLFEVWFNVWISLTF